MNTLREFKKKDKRATEINISTMKQRMPEKKTERERTHSQVYSRTFRPLCGRLKVSSGCDSKVSIPGILFYRNEVALSKA